MFINQKLKVFNQLNKTEESLPLTVFCQKNHSKKKSAIRNQNQKKSASNNHTNEVKKKK